MDDLPSNLSTARQTEEQDRLGDVFGLRSALEEIRERFDPRTLLVEPLDDRMKLADLKSVGDIRPLTDSPAFEIELAEGVAKLPRDVPRAPCARRYDPATPT